MRVLVKTLSSRPTHQLMTDVLAGVWLFTIILATLHLPAIL